jgi:hypothetical protein
VTPVAVVVPSNRPGSIAAFCEAWRIKPSTLYTLYVVEDSPEPTFTQLPGCAVHLSHADVPPELAGAILPRSSAVRSLGFYKALEAGHELFLTLDDDCLPGETYNTLEALIHAHAALLARNWSPADVHPHFFPTMAEDYARGYPESLKDREPRRAAVSVGSWSNVPDIDGDTQRAHEAHGMGMPAALFETRPVPVGVGYTLSGMHLMFTRDVVPLMYFFPTLGTFYRYDDIMLGHVLKHVLDASKAVLVHAGGISVRHARASDSERNAELENRNRGKEYNDALYHAVRDLRSSTLWGALEELPLRVPHPYFKDVCHLWKRYSTACEARLGEISRR